MSHKPLIIATTLAFISALFWMPPTACANPKRKLADYICLDEGIVWKGVLKKDTDSDQFITALEDVKASYKRQYGSCLSYEISGNIIKFNFGEKTARVKIVTENNKIAGFWLKEVNFNNDSFKKVEEDLNKLHGKVSVTVVSGDGAKIFGINEDTPLSIASTFKLFVLKALKDKIKSGEIKWDDVVFIKDNQRSYSSGIMQDWSTGTPVTIKKLATLMISISDNTASDILIDFLGRAEVEKYSQLNRPFLKTKELFFLENKNLEGLSKKYLNSNYASKLKILEKISNKKLIQIDCSNLKFHPDYLGWFATTTELCDTTFTLKDEPIITINSGILSDSKRWPFIGYKGGSEPGVLQLTQIIKSRNGRWYCISTTWNDQKEVDENAFIEFVSRLAALLPD